MKWKYTEGEIVSLVIETDEKEDIREKLFYIVDDIYATGNTMKAIKHAIEEAEVGTYYYRVVEVNAGKTINGVTYDSTVYNFDVVVADADLDGKLEIADVVSTNATIAKENDSFGVVVSFTNTYAPSGNAEIKLNINKEITNNTSETIGKDGYTFELYDACGEF